MTTLYTTGEHHGHVIQVGDKVFITEAWMGLIAGMAGTVVDKSVIKKKHFLITVPGRRGSVLIPKRILTKKWF